MIDYNQYMNFIRGSPMKPKNRFTLTHFYKKNQKIVNLTKKKFGLRQNN
jgi:hypothetical protein